MKEVLNDWLEVKFLKNGNNKFGCDCLGLVIGVYKEIGKDSMLLNFEDFFLKYRFSNNLNMVLNEKLIIDLEKFYYFIDISQSKIGDLIIFSSKKNPIHFAIYYENESCICANNILGKVLLMKISDIYYEKLLFLRLKE